MCNLKQRSVRRWLIINSGFRNKASLILVEAQILEERSSLYQVRSCVYHRYNKVEIPFTTSRLAGRMSSLLPTWVFHPSCHLYNPVTLSLVHTRAFRLSRDRPWISRPLMT